MAGLHSLLPFQNHNVMKSLKEMNNTERAYLLASLFPDELDNITEFIKKEITVFREKETEYRKSAKACIASTDYWYILITEVEKINRTYNVMLHRSPRVFADQYFYSHNSVFTIHCLMEYAKQDNVQLPVKMAIDLLFGDEPV